LKGRLDFLPAWRTMNFKHNRCKCRCCNLFFHPDPHNPRRQFYCFEPDCRRASKAASQRRWLRKPANRDYFRDGANVERVQQWRKANPGYWKRCSFYEFADPQGPLKTVSASGLPLQLRAGV